MIYLKIKQESEGNPFNNSKKELLIIKKRKAIKNSLIIIFKTFDSNFFHM